MSEFSRRRARPIAATLTISTAALMLFSYEASAQEATKPVPDAPAANGASPPANPPPLPATTTVATPPPAATTTSAPAAKNPALPEVKIIQDKPKPAPVQEAAPQPKKKPATAVEDIEPESAPAPKPKKKKVLTSEPPPKQKTKAVQKSAPAPKPEPQEPALALVNATGTYNPALDLDGFDLPPGTTITTAGPVYGYRALTAMSSTKTATPLERIPQSIQVVPKSVIDDQNNLTVSETVQNISNVQGPNSKSLADTQLYPYTIRGFGAQAWLDGFVMPFSAGDRDAFANVERIEVLKGPAAILYGGGAGAPIGGAINIVSKLPTDKASGEFGITFGSNGYVQPYFDINQPLSTDGKGLFRLTGEYTATDSFIDVLEQDRYSIHPTLTLTDKNDTTLTIQGRLSKVKQQTYQGLPVTGTILGGFQLDRDLFIGPSNIPRGFSEVQGLTVSFDRKLNDVWSANVKARWSKSAFEQNTQLVVGSDFAGGIPAVPPSTWLLANSELHEDVEEFSINPNAQAKFTIGESRNTLLVGADYSRVRENGFLQSDYIGNGCAAFFGVGPCFGLVGPTVDLLNPSFTTHYADPRGIPQYQDFFGFDQVVMFSNVENSFTTKGAYAQLQSSFYDRIHVLAGVRSSSVEIEQVENALGFPQITTTDATKVLPRAGIVVDLISGLSVYASYSEGMRAVPRQSPGGKSLPEFSMQSEAGFKFNINSQLSGTVAVFDIERDNVAVNLGGLGNVGLASQTGRGFETDLIWQPNRNWMILANYGYTNVEFGDGLLGVAAGNKFPIVPEHSGRVWMNYAFDEPILRGWSVGAGVYAASSQFVDAANQFQTNGYFTVDAKVGYTTDAFAASFNVKNLTGEEYFVPYAFLGAQVAPGDDRAYYGTLVYKY